MKTLGMIGGTSWHSTIVYYRLINELTGERIGTLENPPLLLYSLNVALMREQNSERIKKTYLEISRKLEKAGAEAIIICANTPHMVYNFVQPKINIPILHITDAVGKAAGKMKIEKLGLLGTKPTMKGGFIHERLKNKYKIETIIPDGNFIDQNHDYIAEELTQGRFTEEAKTFYLHQIQLLKDKGAEGVILGCTELPMLIQQKDTDIPLIDTTQLHAEMAVDFILEEKSKLNIPL